MNKPKIFSIIIQFSDLSKGAKRLLIYSLFRLSVAERTSDLGAHVSHNLTMLPESTSLFHVLEVWEERGVALALQIFPLHLLEDGVVGLLLEDGAQPRLHHNVLLLRLVILN